MKIVIQGVEICGIISDLAREMSSQGHEVVTIADHNRYFQNDYQYRLSQFLHDYAAELQLPYGLGTYAVKLLYLGFKPGYQRLSSHCRDRICLDADLYVQVWSGWPGEYRLLRRLRKKGVKIATLFMGSEVRYYPCFQQQYHEQDWEFPNSYHSAIHEKLHRLRIHERYSDAIFSVPDQMGLALRPYHHLLVPICYEEIEFNVPNREKPLVVHAPTNKGIKGSSVIENALSELKNEGCEFDYLPLMNVPHESMLQALSAADVLVDELLLHGPGWLGFEAMAAGCAVATRYLDSSPPIFKPPVLPIDRQCVIDQLRLLLSDQSLRRELAIKGRQYVESNNGISHVVESLIAKTLDEKPIEDYDPVFFRKFEPTSNEERREIELTTKIVANESWYRE